MVDHALPAGFPSFGQFGQDVRRYSNDARRIRAADFTHMAERLKRMLARQIDALERHDEDAQFDEARVKALLSLSRALQAMEELIRKREMAADERGVYAEDIVAFRERLAKQLDALGESGAEPSVSGKPRR